VELPTHSLNILVGMIVATFKASLVALIFMHLNHERSVIYKVLVFTVVWFLVLFVLFYFSRRPAVFEGFYKPVNNSPQRLSCRSSTSTSSSSSSHLVRCRVLAVDSLLMPEDAARAGSRAELRRTALPALLAYGVWYISSKKCAPSSSDHDFRASILHSRLRHLHGRQGQSWSARLRASPSSSCSACWPSCLSAPPVYGIIFSMRRRSVRQQLTAV
jgi:hypothetical protein